MTMLSDDVLVDRVVAGFEGDFEELYRRHASAAWRVAQAVTGNAHDAADAVAEAFARVLQAVKAGRLADSSAFRGYLLTATRNASLDTLRRAGKTRPTADDDLDGLDFDTTGPAEALTGADDAAMIAEAFRNLPERWRSVLWLTEVEGVPTKDVAEQLGISANGAAQLAVRARAGLRERYLQAHLKTTAVPDCRFTVDRLGAYVGGGLAPRDLAKVDQHLAGCEPCRAKKEELEDLGSSLRRIVLPLPLALAGVAGARVTTALTSSSASLAAAVPSMGGRIMAAAQNPTPRLQKLLAGTTASVFGVGLFAITLTGGPRPKFADLATPAGADPIEYALDLPTADDLSFDRVSAFNHRSRAVAIDSVPAFIADLPRSAPAAPAATPPAPAPVAAPAAAPAAAAPPAPTQPSDSGAALPDMELPLPEEPVVDVNIGGRAGDNAVAATVEISNEPSVGVLLGDTVIGEEPDAPDEDGLTVVVDPMGADPVEISLP